MIELWQMILDLSPVLGAGLSQTMLIWLGAAVVTLCVALLIGISASASMRSLRFPAIAYIEFFRGTSALVQLFWFAFALPQIMGIRIPLLLVAILVLGLNFGAYAAEVLRGALAAMPKGQHEAARALGLSQWQSLRHIILPQTLIAVLPPFNNISIELLKNTALAAVIGINDLVQQARFEQHRHLDQALLLWGLILLVFYAISMLANGSLRALERKLRRRMHLGGTH